MKILIYGENWEGALPNLLYNSLQKREYECRIFDFTDFIPGIKDRSLLGRIKRRIFFNFYIRKINRLLFQTFNEFSPDFVIVSKGLYIDKYVLKSIKKTESYLINWNPDDFLNMKNSSQKLISSISEYDLIVSSREHQFDLYKELGAKKLLFIDWYYVPNLHTYKDVEYKYNASFVGSWSPSREKFIDQLDVQFHIWGGGWEKSSAGFKNKHIVHQRILNQKEMVLVFSSSRYNLNMLTHENKDFTNLRMFEVTASGGLLLTERNEAAIKYFQDGKEVLMYTTSQDVNNIFLKEYDCKKIAMCGLERTIKDGNSFEDRVTVLLEEIGKN